ncbi:MAG: hypothetical protein ACUVR8_12985 [Acidobacteriota bacterium]
MSYGAHGTARHTPSPRLTYCSVFAADETVPDELTGSAPDSSSLCRGYTAAPVLTCVLNRRD